MTGSAGERPESEAGHENEPGSGNESGPETESGLEVVFGDDAGLSEEIWSALDAQPGQDKLAGDRGVPPHPDLAPLTFLLGRWEGAGIGGYPTIESFRFGQEITFRHNGKPFLIYTSRTWRLAEDGTIGPPLGTETGYWRPRPEGKIEVMLAHPTGIVEIYLGEITGTRIEIVTDVVARTATAKEVTGGRRLYGLPGGDLAWAYDLAAVGQPLQAHLSALLKRVG